MNKVVKLGYRPQSPDTSIKTDIYFFSRLRQLSLQQRIAQASAHNRSIRKFSLAGIKWQHQNAGLIEIRERFARAVLAEKFCPEIELTGIDQKMWIQDSFALVGEIHQLLESVNIPYYVIGLWTKKMFASVTREHLFCPKSNSKLKYLYVIGA